MLFPVPIVATLFNRVVPVKAPGNGLVPPPFDYNQPAYPALAIALWFTIGTDVGQKAKDLTRYSPLQWGKGLFWLVPRAGVEPAHRLRRGILSPLCLPISPPRQKFKHWIEENPITKLSTVPHSIIARACGKLFSLCIHGDLGMSGVTLLHDRANQGPVGKADFHRFAGFHFVNVAEDFPVPHPAGDGIAALQGC